LINISFALKTSNGQSSVELVGFLCPGLDYSMIHKLWSYSRACAAIAAWGFYFYAIKSELSLLQNKNPQLSLRALVPGTGFEPAHLAAPPPEDGASTNFATRAGVK
jgi:hypothetical protein